MSTDRLAEIRKRAAYWTDEDAVWWAADILYLLAHIDALEEVRKATKAEARARDAMLDVVPVGAYGEGHAQLMTAWIDAGVRTDAALDAVDP